jgi:hypothetical protein
MSFLAENVDRGAAFLDKEIPDWRNKINVSILEMDSESNCVASQLFSNRYSLFINKFKLTREQAIHFGFIAPDHGGKEHDSQYSLLNELWKAKICEHEIEAAIVVYAQLCNFPAKPLLEIYLAGKNGTIPPFLKSVRKTIHADKYKHYLELREFFEHVGHAF